MRSRTSALTSASGVRERIESATEAFEAGVDDYSTRTATQAAIDLAAFGNEYIQRNEPWNLDDDEAAPVVRDCVQLAKAVAVLVYPTTPDAASQIWAQLDEAGSVADAGIEAALEAPSREFDEPTELFEKIDEERVEELNRKLEERVEDADTEANEGERGGDDEEDDEGDEAVDLDPLADERVGFEDFEALDIRVGRITAAEPIEGSDKLVRLEVDIGLEQRQVVAGIKRLHDVDALSDTKVVLLANMERAELFGVESNGMILAAGDEADLLTTHGDAPVGTKIR